MVYSPFPTEFTSEIILRSSRLLNVHIGYGAVLGGRGGCCEIMAYLTIHIGSGQEMVALHKPW